MQIVCISYTQWERSERFQRLINALPEAQVLFFEPEQPLLSRLRRPREGVRVTDQVYAYTLPANVPTGEDSGVQITQRSRKNVSFVRRCMADLGVEQPLLWLTCPDQAGFLYEFTGARGVVYDCDRDWRGFPYDWEAAVTEEADVVLAASRDLAQRLSPLNDNVAILPNGVDYQAYAPAAEGFDALPADLERIPSPVIGYLGEVTGFTILSPVMEAAQNHPEWSFVFAGPYSRRNPLFAKVSKLENVHFLGEKSPSTLPRYLSGFDVCFSLLSEHEKDPSVVSEQIYRYLAACKPVAMLSGGRLDRLDKTERLVSACHFDYEFSVTLEGLLDLELDPERRVRQRDYARRADWSLCSQRLAELLSAAGLS
jgi:glycosyltransferase involved in cell wall biosynthesis